MNFIFTRHQGFDAGIWAHDWYRWGPFVLVRYVEGVDTCPHCGDHTNVSDWRLLVFFTKKALGEFWEGASK